LSGPATLSRILGLPVEQTGGELRILSTTRVPLYGAFLSGRVGGGYRWIFKPILDGVAIAQAIEEEEVVAHDGSGVVLHGSRRSG